MTPRLEACYFGEDRTGQWSRLAAVLRATAAAHCATWNINVRHIQPKRHRSAALRPSNVANTQKLEEWCRLVAEAPDGQPLLLIDADTVILRPLDDLWAKPFDLAYTVKPGARFPFNGGVLPVRVSPAVRAFFQTWWTENLRMLRDTAYHGPFRKRYGGLNQAAFGALLERGGCTDLQLLTLPCQEWNCEDATWRYFEPATTRILHIKDGLEQANLRKAIFDAKPALPPAHVAALAARWLAIEAGAQAQTRRTA